MKRQYFCLGGLFVAISIFNVSCSVFGIRSEETPQYEVLKSEGGQEIRSYSKYLTAKTVVKGDFKKAQNEAFRILAGYIFGGNQQKQKLSMTAPVVQEKPGASEKMSMTAPVVQSSSDEGWVMTFVMPSKYKMEDLPIPNDPRVVLEEVPAKIVGVIQYSGLGREATNSEMASRLKAWLSANEKYAIVGAPAYAGYDPPWTLPFLRRNEMMFELKLKP